MSKAAETARTWLGELVRSANLSDAERTALETTLSKPEALEFVGRGVLRQQDYDRAMNQSKADFQNKLKEVQRYEQELATWRAGAEKTYSQVQNELAQARAEAQRVRQVAYSYNLTDEDLGAPVNPATAPPGTQDFAKETPAQLDPSKYLSREDFNAAAAMHTLLPAELNDIVAEHVELFGKQPRDMRQMVEKAVAAQRPIREIWEEQYEVSNKRQELADAAREGEIARRVEEELVKYRSENRLPAPRPQSEKSYVLGNRDKLTPPEDRASMAGDHMSSVNAAVQFWNTLDRSGE